MTEESFQIFNLLLLLGCLIAYLRWKWKGRQARRREREEVRRNYGRGQ